MSIEETVPGVDIIIIQQNGEFDPSCPISSMGLVDRDDRN